MNTFYNVGSADISQGLQDFEISSGQDYFILLSAPSNANVQIRLNENTAPQIPIKEHWQFKSADVKKIYISCEPIAGESIKWGQADGNLKITTNPTINAIDTISQMGVTFAEQMDKITNPYENEVIHETFKGATASQLVVADFTIDCDKLLILPLIPIPSAVGHNAVQILLDEKRIAFFNFYYGGGSTSSSISQFKLLDVKGKRLKIIAHGANSAEIYSTGVSIQKFNLKA